MHYWVHLYMEATVEASIYSSPTSLFLLLPQVPHSTPSTL